MATTNEHEAQVRRLVEDWAGAVRRRDMGGWVHGWRWSLPQPGGGARDRGARAARIGKLLRGPGVPNARGRSPGSLAHAAIPATIPTGSLTRRGKLERRCRAPPFAGIRWRTPDMWRAANSLDDEAIARMCLALNAEDPGPEPVPPAYTRRTLVALRESPWRGHAAVLEVDGQVCGYALVISFWSNELGGKVWVIDEIYVDPEHRGRGYATSRICAGTARRDDDERRGAPGI